MSEKIILGKNYWRERAKTGNLSSEEKMHLAEMIKQLSQIGYIFDTEELSEIFGLKLTYRIPQGEKNGK